MICAIEGDHVDRAMAGDLDVPGPAWAYGGRACRRYQISPSASSGGSRRACPGSGRTPRCPTPPAASAGRRRRPAANSQACSCVGSSASYRPSRSAAAMPARYPLGSSALQGTRTTRRHHRLNRAIASRLLDATSTRTPDGPSTDRCSRAVKLDASDSRTRKPHLQPPGSSGRGRRHRARQVGPCRYLWVPSGTVTWKTGYCAAIRSNSSSGAPGPTGMCDLAPGEHSR